jgi:hypothetical protein
MYVTISSHNMGEIEGIRRVLRGATAKYVVDLIFDSLIYRWEIKIPHSTTNSDSHKIRLAERHFTFVEQYATQRHISVTLAVNLILNDYFSSRTNTKNAETAQITPTLIKNEPSIPNVPSQDKPKAPRGAALLQNLKQ